MPVDALVAAALATPLCAKGCTIDLVAVPQWYFRLGPDPLFALAGTDRLEVEIGLAAPARPQAPAASEATDRQRALDEAAAAATSVLLGGGAAFAIDDGATARVWVGADLVKVSLGTGVGQRSDRAAALASFASRHKEVRRLTLALAAGATVQRLVDVTDALRDLRVAKPSLADPRYGDGVPAGFTLAIDRAALEATAPTEGR